METYRVYTPTERRNGPWTFRQMDDELSPPDILFRALFSLSLFCITYRYDTRPLMAIRCWPWQLSSFIDSCTKMGGCVGYPKDRAKRIHHMTSVVRSCVRQRRYGLGATWHCRSTERVMCLKSGAEVSTQNMDDA